MIKLYTFFKRVPTFAKALWKAFKHGGFSSTNISFINHGEILKDKNIIITGGSSGIGLSIAKKCIKEGATVLITGRNEEKLNRARDEINNPKLKTLVWDISIISEIQDNLQKTIELFEGRVDILVNNAGIVNGTQFPNVTEEIWDKIYDTNSKGLFFLSQSIGKLWMKEKNRKSHKKIINISSQGGFVGATYPYRMTKWDIAGLTQGLGLKLAPYGIIVNGIAPGIIATQMQLGYLNQKENMYCSLNPIERYALPEEIAELAVFLMSDASNFIVGQTIVCDGGYSIK
ncbi:MAG: 3-oxoacyl-ACP reductase [Bacteroidia bacterium 44-10]|nr:MAG: 3-oxoacyl-ACP reductase [Bacteroidia bacterium 44-10]